MLYDYMCQRHSMDGVDSRAVLHSKDGVHISERYTLSLHGHGVHLMVACILSVATVLYLCTILYFASRSCEQLLKC